MKTRTKQGLVVLRRVHDFLAATDVPAAMGSVAKNVEALGQNADRLAAHAVEQDVSARAFRAAARAAQKQVRTLRREYMLPVARLGRALFPNDPVLQQSLEMPEKQDYEGLIAAAFAMADRASEHKDRFIANGFSDDFADRLRKAATDLRSLLDEKAIRFGRRSAATAGLDQELARGKDLVRLLDVMVAPRLEDSHDRLAEWRTLSRFVRVGRTREGSITPPVVVPVIVPSGTPGITPDAAIVGPNDLPRVDPVTKEERAA